MKLKLSIIKTIFLLCIPTFVLALNPIQKRINQSVAEHYNVGIAVVTISPSDTKYYFAGKQNKRKNAKPINKNSIFPIASISKVFTTLAFAEQVEKGRIKLTTPAQSCLPKGYQLPTNKGIIQVVNLATHTAGMPAPHKVIIDNPFAKKTA